MSDPRMMSDLRVWIRQLDRTRRTALFRAQDSDIETEDIETELPLDPMHGTVGVAPANLEVRSTLVPDAHGGNMDTLGNGHARQGEGEGETRGVVVECAMNTVVIVEVLKGLATPWPRIESDTHIISTGSARPLEDAFRRSQLDLVQWLVRDQGFSELDAYQFATQCVEAPLAKAALSKTF